MSATALRMRSDKMPEPLMLLVPFRTPQMPAATERREPAGERKTAADVPDLIMVFQTSWES